MNVDSLNGSFESISGYKMSRITRIVRRSDQGRVWIFVDGEYCTSVRERTFDALGIVEGSECTCADIKQREKFIWKSLYSNSWGDEKKRIDRVRALISGFKLGVSTEVVGFGADSTEPILEHPKEPGIPDLELRSQNSNILIARLEVTGTERYKPPRRFWLRPDKLQYCHDHPEIPVWFAVHFAEPEECIRFIFPQQGKKYRHVTRSLKGADEFYVEFSDDDIEVFRIEEFRAWLRVATLQAGDI